MKIQSLSAAESLLDPTEPTLLVKDGHAAGLFLPLGEGAALGDDLRRDLFASIGRQLSDQLEAAGISEETILEDFDVARREPCR